MLDKTNIFHSQLKFVEECLRPAGLMMSGHEEGIMHITLDPDRIGVRCKICVLKPIINKNTKGRGSNNNDGFVGPILNHHGKQILFHDRPLPFEYLICIHEVVGMKGGMLGISSMGEWPINTGITVIPSEVLIDKLGTNLTEIRLPQWYFVAAESAKAECVLCGTHSVLGTSIPLHRCKLCRLPSYCSVTCQTADWRAGHQFICSTKLKLETAKGHWTTPYVTRTESLSIDYFPRLSTFLTLESEENVSITGDSVATIGSAWGSVSSRLSSPSRGGSISRSSSRENLIVGSMPTADRPGEVPTRRGPCGTPFKSVLAPDGGFNF